MQKMTNVSDLPLMSPKSLMSPKYRRSWPLPAAAVVLVACGMLLIAAPQAAQGDPDSDVQPVAGDLIDGKRLIGATAIVTEAKSGISFAARVDTGAQGTSLHIEEWEIDGKSEKKALKKNIGKQIRFRTHNRNGQDAWLEGLIVDTVLIKNAEKTERRYKVVVKLRVGDFEKECIVNVNDRSDMTYPILIGRNFLHGDFLVDVSLDENVAVEAPSGGESDADAGDEEEQGAEAVEETVTEGEEVSDS